jgi:membrane associated rhomboid family serine protease
MAAWNFIIFYFVIELVFMVLSLGSGVAHGAHVFGFVGGYLFAIVFRRVKLAREKGRAGDEFFVPGYHQ